MLALDPNSRISVEKAMKHTWMTAPDVGGNPNNSSNSTKRVRVVNKREQQKKVNRNASDSRVSRDSSAASYSGLPTYNSPKNSNKDLRNLLDQICRDFGKVNVQTCVRGCQNGCVRDCATEVPSCIQDCSCHRYLRTPV
jgi:serine/threonine protein kinase